MNSYLRLSIFILFVGEVKSLAIKIYFNLTCLSFFLGASEVERVWNKPHLRVLTNKSSYLSVWSWRRDGDLCCQLIPFSLDLIELLQPTFLEALCEVTIVKVELDGVILQTNIIIFVLSVESYRLILALVILKAMLNRVRIKIVQAGSSFII